MRWGIPAQAHTASQVALWMEAGIPVGWSGLGIKQLGESREGDKKSTHSMPDTKPTFSHTILISSQCTRGV
jgi:hypothetical protein